MENGESRVQKKDVNVCPSAHKVKHRLRSGDLERLPDSFFVEDVLIPLYGSCDKVDIIDMLRLAESEVTSQLKGRQYVDTRGVVRRPTDVTAVYCRFRTLLRVVSPPSQCCKTEISRELWRSSSLSRSEYI